MWKNHHDCAKALEQRMYKPQANINFVEKCFIPAFRPASNCYVYEEVNMEVSCLTRVTSCDAVILSSNSSANFIGRQGRS